MPASARSLGVLLVSLVASTALSGCINAQAMQDWWDDIGTVMVKVGTLPAESPGQRVHEFSTVKLALRSTVVYAVNEISPLGGITYNPPLGVDLKTRLDEGEFLRVFETKAPTKTVNRIAFTLVLVEAKDHAGNKVPACPQDASKKDPEKACIAMARSGNYEFDLSPRPTALARGGVTEFHFPLVVGYSEEVNEYYLQGRSHASEAPVIVR